MSWMRNTNDPLIHFEVEYEIAAANLGVAEDFAWLVGILAGLVAGMLTHWALGFLASALAFYFSTVAYRHKDRAAQDAYFRAAGIGAYGYAARKVQEKEDSAG